MGSYKVIFKPSVEKDLRSLPQEAVKRILKRIEALKNDPIPRQSVKLSGAEQLWRIRVGEYRVIFGIDKAHLQVVVHHVRHRREVYRHI